MTPTARSRTASRRVLPPSAALVLLVALLVPLGLAGTASGLAPEASRPTLPVTGDLDARRSRGDRISVGGEHGCRLPGSGALLCWGRDQYGQLGDGKVGPDMSSEGPVRGGNKWREVSSGGASTCGIKNSGKLFCWGVNHRGQIGDRSTKVRSKPVVVNKSTKWKDVSASWFNTCGITRKAKLLCWGDNAAGQLGKTKLKQSAKPVPLPGKRWKQVSVGSRFACGIKAEGTLFCWGGNMFGQLGNGSWSGSPKPRRVTSAKDWVQVDTSWSHTCARNTGGQVYCWGRNTYGSLGNGNVTTTASPQLVLGSHRATDVAVLEGASCLLDDKGKTWCWGNNAYGVIGDGTQPFALEPVAGPSGFSEIDAGWRSVCGATSSGFTCWGANDRSQLGNGTTTSSPSPAEVEPLPLPDPSGGTDFRIATVNVLGNGHTRPYAHDDAYGPATTRMGWFADQLDNSAIDIMGLQEPNSDQVFHLLKAARGTWDVWPRPELGDDYVESPVAWRTSVWEAVEKTEIVTQFISRALPRPVVKLRHRVTGQEIWVISVHNAPSDYVKKRNTATNAQVAKINELRATGLPVFFVGDMNDKRTVLCKVLSKTDLVSPYGGSYDPVTRRCTNPPSRMRVDWIFGPAAATYSNFGYFRPPLLSIVTDHQMALVDVLLPPTAPTPPPTEAPTPTQTPTPTPTTTASPGT